MEYYSFNHLKYSQDRVSGDMLRKHITQGTEIGKSVQEVVEHGGLVPDLLMDTLVLHEVDEMDGMSWMLDGFPRTIQQAEALDAHLEKKGQKIDLVINLDVPEEVILGRIKDRWIHAPSGRTYNLSFNPPKVPGRDDITGEPLSKRPDDDVDIFALRLRKYHELTEPLIQYYQSHGKVASFFGRTSNEISPKLMMTLLELFKGEN
ncbi:hypothetical protein HK102_005267 [Quaeritorhiza haematococci]|nr:hypothetical protein HK102_005267 [Quaeritorhiza haematococci]